MSPRFTALALVSTVLLPRMGQACSCAFVGTAALLDKAHAVFTGEVIRAEIVDGGGVLVKRKAGSVRAPAAAVTFRTHAVWKGSIPSQARVWTIVGPHGMCGVDFRIGEKYLIFATNDASDPRWEAKTDLCMGSGQIHEKATRRHLQELGDPRHVFPVSAWWGDLLDVE